MATDHATYALLIDGGGVAGAGTRVLRAYGGHRCGAVVGDRPAQGTVWINEHLAIGSEMPHGGVEGSRFGKDMSMYALEEHTAVKHA